MPQYGFVIDQRKCIGCHACTVACKAENEVPLGSYRTWVKYVEKGRYPEVRRHFTVLRCNHCDAAPCVEICPVVALHKRPDAIVDLDRDLCIGCRACMQACPYDALYLNEDTGTAEKCHYCAHRTELGLEPACVVVCPEEAIVAGDVADATSEIATLIREQPVQQRRLEKGTRPRAWYVDALPEALEPGAAAERDTWLWAQRRRVPAVAPGFEPPPDLWTTLNADARVEWGWHIWTYLLTKNLAAGAMLLAPFLPLLGVRSGVWPEAVALLFLAATGFLLVHDLGRPERFLKILLHPNPRSWLVKGTWILLGFGLLTAASLGAGMSGLHEAQGILRWLALPLALFSSGYSAFLFAQCKGRDLWLEKGFFAALTLRAAFLGAAFAGMLPREPGSGPELGFLTFGLSLLVLGQILVARASGAGPEEERRARAILFARPELNFSLTLLFLAVLMSLAGLFMDQTSALLGLTTLVLACMGLFVFERAWILAGQEPANS